MVLLLVSYLLAKLDARLRSLVVADNEMAGELSAPPTIFVSSRIKRYA